MATWTIQIPRNQYTSLQVGDEVYSASNLVSGSGFQQMSTGLRLGDIASINNTTSLDDGTETTTLVINAFNTGGPSPSINDFVFFVKDSKVNMTSLLGYFAKMQFKNNDRDRAELFAVSTEISESSK
tara:strand:- start:954 stop:1334 length:381 start_codon:yes stop_codon:yes gene_type:complete